LRDWDKILNHKYNQEKLERLNIPKWNPNQKIMILDKYCPYSLDEVVSIKPYKDYKHDELGMHGTWAAQVVKIIAGDNLKFYGAGWEGTNGLREVVDFCIENNIKIISASINFFYQEEREEILKRFYDWGGIFITTAGNVDGKSVNYPGSSSYTLCVSATNSEDNDGEEIDITADSYWYVRNKNNGTFTPFNGTSASAPVITGCVCYILEKYSNWHCEDVRNFLKENSTMDMESLEKYESFFNFPNGFGKEEVRLNNPDKIILHHSLTKDGEVKDYDSIKKYHIKTLGWIDIGYHYLIEKVGDKYEILRGRDERDSGAHTKGENTTSIGICLVGNFDIAPPPKEQLEQLYILIEDIFARHGKLPIYTHNHFASYKTCPGTQFPIEEVLTVAYNQNNLSDIKGHWAEEDIKLVVEKGIMKGYPDGTFQPDKPLTRAEYAHMRAEQIRKEQE